MKLAFRMVCIAAIAAGPGLPVATPAQAGPISLLRVSAADGLPAIRQVTLGLDKSMVVELPVAARDVMVSNPSKIDAVMQTSRRAYVIGKGLGEANVFFTDQQGNQVLTLEVSVQRDLRPLENLIARLIPGSNVRVEAINKNVVLTGSVRTPVDATRASEIVNKFLGANEDQASGSSSGGSLAVNISGAASNTGSSQTDSRVINMITVEGEEQVLLKVSIVEMERNTAKQLGVDLDAVVNSGNFQFAALSSLPFPVNQGAIAPATAGLGWASGSDSVDSVLQALEQNGLIHTLAEPNLTAISGETANFLAGGEFPIVTGVDATTNTASVDFKQFGVGLAFTPVVMSEGRISLKISTEVSELSDEGAITTGGFTIPALKVRRAQTTVELPSGGSLVIAGLLSDQSRQDLTGYPGLKNLPVLGTLFRSRDFQKNESELVVMVTPYIAKAVAKSKLTAPDEGFGWASDVNADLMGQMNRIYGRHPEPAAIPAGPMGGDVGFIVE
ncbi:type II and III secretion system protein family protein [Methyloligella sp. 2.7D]|uniref:type II and III secretion system protein family protein n=1 Tax=unclassified Methyloligella TaxID=2625955 RepID=UPI00157D1B8B|nr:type II and III secretion system protein family protein [Methyloligella sp. GL2]QKP78587.1 type II and III secretion system protein family protein [Methyloligella sp. GL2]